jgi:undecaprenyl-diphosphatase
MAVWYANRKWGIVYLILVALMGVARIYVGVHWPLDILGGAAIGILSAMIIHWAFDETRQKLEKHHLAAE